MATKSKEQIKIKTTAVASPFELKEYLKIHMSANKPTFIWGSPGIGKSEIVKQLGAELGRPVIDMRLILMAPEDLKGIPYYNPAENTLEWAPSSEFPQIINEEEVAAQKVVVGKYEGMLATINAEFTESEGKRPAVEEFEMFEMIERISNKVENARKRLNIMNRHLELQDAILFLDELPSAMQSVQGAAYQLIQDRRIGQYELPDGVSIIGAGNYKSDKGHTHTMPTPLANRFQHIGLEVSFADWQTWAMESGVHSDIVGFLTAHCDKLHRFNPASGEMAFATPRSWFNLGKIMDTDEDMNYTTLSAMVSGAVGAGMANEFIAHRRQSKNMPSPHDILAGKVTRLDTDETSALYSIVISCIYVLREELTRIYGDDQVSDDTFHTIINNFYGFLLDVMPAEMIILSLTVGLGSLSTLNYRVNRKLTPNFLEIHKQYGSLIRNA